MGGFLNAPFSNLDFFFQSRFPKRMWFLRRLSLNLLKNHIPFENSACEGGFLKSPFSVFSNLTFQSRFPKRMWFLSRFRLNLPKNHFLFENSAREGGFLKALFSNLAFQSPFPKRMWFLSSFRLNLIKNHVPFENSAREGGFLKAPESRLCRFIDFHDFHNECGFDFLSRSWLKDLKGIISS